MTRLKVYDASRNTQSVNLKEYVSALLQRNQIPEALRAL